MRLGRDTRGAVYIEFLVAFIPMFVLFLGLLQVSLIFIGKFVVRHAANRATRAAIVVLDDDPERYDGERENRVSYSDSGSLNPQDSVVSFLREVGGGEFSSGRNRGSARLNAIRAAASIPLLAISPSFDQLVGRRNVERAIGGSGVSRAAVGAAVYNRAGMAVTFPTRPEGTNMRTSFREDDDVTVRVTYLFHCGIPIAAHILCDRYLSLRTGISLDAVRRVLTSGGNIRQSAAAIRTAMLEQARVDRSQAGMDELGYAEMPELGFLTELGGSRFYVLRAEATLRNHGAPYRY
jgi:hypothetical protein